MAETLNLCPIEINLCFTRADSLPFTFTLTDSVSGAAIDITGGSFLLTVNTDPEPTDASDQVFQLTGVITDGPNGVVEFTPSAANLDQTPGVLFYDVQWTDASSNVRTVIKGEIEIRQDITK